jgi:hypothetical protein
MQSISNWLSPDSAALKIAVVAAVVVAAILIITVVYRLVFGHRLRVPGASRARQPRLGLVDAFSLDGQRQLVLVRRDNVEHLIMIGGPNDVLLESQIVRAVAAQPREPSLKPPVTVVDPLHGQVEGAAPRVEAAPVLRRVEATGPRPAARQVPPAVREPPPAVREPPPAVREPPLAVRELPPVREPPPRVEPSVARVELSPARPEPAPAPVRPAAAARPEPARSAPPPPPAPPPPGAVPPRPAAPQRGGLPPPIGAPPTIRGRATPLPPPREGPAAVAPPPGRADAAPSAPSGEPGPTGKPKGDDPFADLESLEAEMARLLGRGG